MAENKTAAGKPQDTQPVEEPAEKNGAKLPNPAYQLLDAIKAALTAGVPGGKIVPILDMARGAKGFKAPVWRSCAEALNEYASEATAEASNTTGTGWTQA